MLPIYVINLPRQTERLSQFKANNKLLADQINVFQAYEGFHLPRRQLVQNGLITENNTYKPRALGILKSHIELWKIAAESENGITIVEDDAIIHPNFATECQKLQENPHNYDFIAWGYNLDWPIRLQTAQGIPSSLASYLVKVGSADTIYFLGQIGPYGEQINKEEYLSQTIVPTFFKSSMFAGLPCYTITPKCAKRLLAQFPIDTYNLRFYGAVEADFAEFGIDNTLEYLCKDMNLVLSFPFLAYSNNEKVTVDKIGVNI